MANIPGISGYVQPGVFARDRVISRGVSIPGGLRIPCIMGEGLREETIVDSAAGSGLDGSADCSPTGDPAGRFFKLQYHPVVNGRTEIYLNGSPLRGIEQQVDTSSFDGQFDFRLDPETGCIELQGSSIADQDGLKYSASSRNVGNGIIPDETCGSLQTIQILDPNAPAERWTVKAVGVIRDSSGNPIPGKTTFTVTGSVSGQIKDSAGQAILFHDSFIESNSGATPVTVDIAGHGFTLVSSSDTWSDKGSAVPEGDGATTKLFKFKGSLTKPAEGDKQVLPGDYLCIDTGIDGYDGYADECHQIASFSYDSVADETTVTLVTASLDSEIVDVDWSIKAVDIFIDNPDVNYDGANGKFSSSTVGKVLMICEGAAAGLYRVKAVTATRRLRIEKLDDPSVGYPELGQRPADDGLSKKFIKFYILETNGILVFGIKPGTTAFAVGDKFYIDINSKILKKNDRLEARYIPVSDINDPELFLSSAELIKKHGQESLENTLSMGAKICFENQAPYVLALQCKPAIPRRTSVTLLEEAVGGIGGFSGDDSDLYIPIPLPRTGLQTGRPDGDTQVNIFRVRNGVETQVFPNKVDFYDASFADSTGVNTFINSSDYAFSYTVVNTEYNIVGNGVNGSIASSTLTFSSPEINFDGDDVDKVIVVQSLINEDGELKTTNAGVKANIFGTGATDINLLRIVSIVNDNTVVVEGADNSDPVISDSTYVQFYITDNSDTTNLRAALLLNRDIMDSNTIKLGDGIKISYIDQIDANFFDTNWFEAFEALEAEECQMVVPLPRQNRSGIFRAAVQHVETMSTITIQKERMTLIGAQQGVTPEALIGLEEVAVEDIGVLEGIQGDDPEEVLDGNTEDLQNYKLSDNYTSNRAVYFYPDQIVRPINGSNTFIDGFYMAAAAAGYLSATQNVAIPLTNKTLSGFAILRDKKYRPVTLNQLGAVGATVVQPVVGGGKVLAGRTTSQSGYVEDEEISIVFIRDRVKEVVRQGLQAFVGVVEDNNTQGAMTSRVVGLLASQVSQGLITNYKNVRVERDKLDPRQWNVYLQFQPAYPINYVFIDIEVGIL
jgi:hypothetical protein